MFMGYLMPKSTHRQGNKGVPKDISPKVNVIGQLELELIYYNLPFQYIIH